MSASLKTEKNNSKTAAKISSTSEEISSNMHEMKEPVEPEKRAKIGVLVSFHEKEFEQMIEQGIQNAALYADKLGIDLVVETASPNSCLSYITALYRLISFGVNGIVFRGIMIKELTRILEGLLKNGIQLIAYNEDIDQSLRTCYVGQGTYHAGQCAASLMKVSCPEEGTILILGDSPAHHPGEERIAGFVDYIKDLEENKLKVTETFYDRGENARAASIIKQKIEENPDICGVFVSGGGLHGVARALEELELIGKIRVIGFDATNSNTTLLKSDAVTFLIDQNPYLQGYKAVKLLADSIYYKKPIEEDIYDVGISIINKFNCD